MVASQWLSLMLLFCAVCFIIPSSWAYDDLALMQYITKINNYRYNGLSYDSIQKLMSIYDADEFRERFPDNFPLAFQGKLAALKQKLKLTRYPTVAQVHDLMLKRFALDFHKLLNFNFEHRRRDATYHTLEIVKVILNLPAFQSIKLKHEKET